jgi:hypothetical protein
MGRTELDWDEGRLCCTLVLEFLVEDVSGKRKVIARKTENGIKT